MVRFVVDFAVHLVADFMVGFAVGVAWILDGFVLGGKSTENKST